MTNLPPPGAGDQPPTTATQTDPLLDPPAEPLLEPPAVPTIDTRNERLDDGVNRCPRCGATDIQLRPSAGLLICLFCRHEWSEARLDETVDNGDLTQLHGITLGSGASDIDTGIGSLVTMKCAGCGAEVVVNTDEQMGSRCHWCRHVLTVNEQVPNGAVPDAVLPFKITHDDAMARIREFAGKRRMFADRGFVREFKPENVVGVYMPYMVVDGNVSADVAGVGEVQTRRYTRGTGDDKETFYDADVYQVERHIDFTVDDLTIESSAERANMDSSVNTNNIINTILPFDTENAVKWNASYLTGFTSEKRDRDVDHLHPILEDQLLSIARSQVVASIDRYDRGVRWERERVDVHGTRWLAMYLPVWLYSHYHEQGGKGMAHYIAVNGRTGEVMGSVPVSHRRLLLGALTVGTVLEGFAIAILAAS
jgi:DNA-directed RNA polymerase subunit RPC12/RpoP